MAQYGKVENPTLDVSDYQQGDFVHWLLYDVESSFGVVSEVGEESVRFVHFESGLPFSVSRRPEYGGIRKATKDETFAHFDSIVDTFEKKIKYGGLSGAISASKQHYLNSVLANLKTNGIDAYTAISTAVSDPETGLYVLMGIYSGQGPSEHLEGLVAVPRLTEKEVSRIMFELKPEGFGNIPKEVRNTHATSHGDLVAMWSYEVPEKARVLVPFPNALEYKDSEWCFSEV